MTMETDRRRTGNVGRPPQSGLADVIELILDKGLVIDAYVRVSLVGIEILTIDARIVVASVDTYLRFAEATNRLDLYAHGGKGLTDLSEGATRGDGNRAAPDGDGEGPRMVDAAPEKAGIVTQADDDNQKESEPQPARRPRRRQRAE